MALGKRYYVDNSSYFDSHPYNTRQIGDAVKASGGQNIRTSHNYGWRNQPKVVTFNASPTQLKKIQALVEKAVGTQWIIIREKDWS